MQKMKQTVVQKGSRVILFLLFAFIISNVEAQNYIPIEGDILLQDLECGELCLAIKEVTFGVDSAEFSHIGIVFNINEKWVILEAISEGVKYTPLLEFFSRSTDENSNPKIWVAKLKDEYSDIIPKVKLESDKYIGKKYDDAFLMDNGKYYCSELIYYIFKSANENKDFFDLEPMTFKSPTTKEFLPAWIDYYKELGIDIPEKKEGINPAGISRSNKIFISQKLGKVNIKK